MSKEIIDELTKHPRFKYVLDAINNQLYDVSEAKPTIYLINKLTEENWQLRRECTELKLVMLEIIRDLEKTEQHEYVKWIRDNCNPELISKEKI